MPKLVRYVVAAAVLSLCAADARGQRILGVTVDPPFPKPGEPIQLTAIGQGPLCSARLVADVGPGIGPLGTVSLGLEACVATPPPVSLPFAQTVTITLPAGDYVVNSGQGFSAPLTVAAFPPLPIQSLFLAHQRFGATVAWHTASAQGVGQPEALTDSSGYFWFFDPSNPEVLVKVIDGTPVNGHFWVFLGGLSDVDYTVTITDRYTGTERRYANVPGTLASRADTTAFTAAF